MRPLLAALALTLVAAVPAGPPAARPASARTTLDLYFIDVEGGQATLMVTPEGESFLVDAGFPGTGTFASTAGDPARARDAQRILAAARDAGITRIDHFLLTHYHADHAGGVPELARLLPIAQFIDHAAPVPEAEAAVPGTRAVVEAYERARGRAAHLDPKPGDLLPFAGAEVRVISSLGEVPAAPLEGTRAANPWCRGTGSPAQEPTENPRSLGLLVRFGAFRFLDPGDLSGAPLFALTCPANLVGLADVYLVAHHGGADAADPAIFASVRPRVAVINNGPRKGAAATALATLRTFPLTDTWQLHRALAGEAANVDDARIANLDESTSAWIKVSANRDGSFTVTNGRTGATTAYPPRAAAPASLMGADELGRLVAPPPTARIAYGPLPEQFVNVRLPRTAGPHPVVLFVHGGCWLARYDIAHAAALEQALADSGWAVWSIEYRRVGPATGAWPSVYADVATAADTMRAFAARFQLDLNRVVAAGHSAGGSFALWLAARPKLPPTSELYAPRPLAVRAVFGMAPAPDLEGLHAAGTCGNVVDKMLGGSPASVPARYDAASPMRLAPIGVPQRLLIGSHDGGWAPIGRAYIARALQAGDATVEVVELPASGHFEMINPASSSWPAVVAALRRTFAALPR
jgi:acetyl esterase/lipase/beta-lactamase superfamily II metal-dependent hydrolase